MYVFLLLVYIKNKLEEQSGSVPQDVVSQLHVTSTFALENNTNS